MRTQTDPDRAVSGEPIGTPIRLLVADDHPIVREGLVTVIRRHSGMQVVGEARDGAEVIELYEHLQPHVVLMDLRMPRVDGIEATATVRQSHPEARILLLTTYGSEEEIYRGIRAGASGYVLKDASAGELIEAIETLHAGGAVLPPRIAERLAHRISGAELTAREVEVLECIASGLSNQSIAAALFVSEGTVKSHIGSILAKLGAHDRTHAVTIGAKRGIIRLDE